MINRRHKLKLYRIFKFFLKKVINLHRINQSVKTLIQEPDVTTSNYLDLGFIVNNICITW